MTGVDLPSAALPGQSSYPPTDRAGHDGVPARPAALRRGAAFVLSTAAMVAACWLGGRVLALLPWTDASAADLAYALPFGYAALISVAGVLALSVDLMLLPLAGAARWVARRLPRLDSARRQTIFAWALVAAIFSVLWLLFGLDVEGARVLLVIVVACATLMHAGLIFFTCLGTGYSLWRGPLALAFIAFCQGFFVPG